MNAVFFLAVLVAVAATEFYDSKYDDFDEQEVIDNPRLLKSFANCFLNKSPCTGEGTNFKNLIPEAIQTECAKCSPKQKPKIRKLIIATKEKYPELYEEFLDFFDPNKEYRGNALPNFLNSKD
nr:venom protein U-MPTX.7-38 [Megalopyge opercularis]